MGARFSAGTAQDGYDSTGHSTSGTSNNYPSHSGSHAYPSGSSTSHSAPYSGANPSSSSAATTALNRSRAASLCGGPSHRVLSLAGLYTNNGASGVAAGGATSSPNSSDSTPGSETPLGRAFLASSLPVHLFSYRDIKCPVCNKLVPPDDVECHLVMCLTRPQISYNEDVLCEDKDECIICLEELLVGDVIARLPCLCIYHKSCIDEWFKVNRSCPEHPGD